MFASQQEFIVENYLSLDNTEYEIICKDEQDKNSLINLLNDKNGNKIIIDKKFYHYENPFIIVKSENKNLCIEISQIKSNQYDILISSNKEIKFSKIEGIFSSFRRNGQNTIQAHLTSLKPKIEIDIFEKTKFEIYYIDEIKKTKWLIFCDND